MAARRTLCGVNLSPIFAEAAAAHAFPGGVVFCARGEQITMHEAFGTTAYDDVISRPVTHETLYDLASVSKMFTLTAFLIAKRAANISENEPLARFLPQFDTDDKRAITLRHLMMHSAGFGLHVQRLHGEPCATWIEKIAAAPLESVPGEKVNYTCTAYFLLARVTEKLCAKPLDDFIEDVLLSPLNISTQVMFAPLENRALDLIAPTELRDDGTPWQGIVHDEAARQWCEESEDSVGFCGNAGLFGTARGLSRFCRMWLNDGEEILHPDDVKSAFSDTLLESSEGELYRGWGWQKNNKTYTGDAPPDCFGHQGFTGPTLFFKPDTRDVVIILNNRVYPTRNGPARFVYHRRIAREHFLKVG